MYVNFIEMHILIPLWIMRCFCLMRLERYYSFKAVEVLFCLGYKGFIYPSAKLWDKWIIMFACFGSQMCFVISAKEARLWLEVVDTVCLLAKKTLKWLVAFKLETLLNKVIKGCDYMYPQCTCTTLFALTRPYHGWSSDSLRTLQRRVWARHGGFFALIIITLLACECWRLGPPSYH